MNQSWCIQSWGDNLKLLLWTWNSEDPSRVLNNLWWSSSLYAFNVSPLISQMWYFGHSFSPNQSCRNMTVWLLFWNTSPAAISFLIAIFMIPLTWSTSFFHWPGIPESETMSWLSCMDNDCKWKKCCIILYYPEQLLLLMTILIPSGIFSVDKISFRTWLTNTWS